ncbi:MAG: xanthine dehydrogenase family protein molybdopterin-binding subunit, partial [Nitrospinota bacterium]|nr:xanthine dehydrogenase family protein molybdopterin-binding subunit [Nitrospinota bacterium]
MSYQMVGKAVPRVEGGEKVTGGTQYASDVAVPGALWCKVLRSPVPHARIVNIDTSRAKWLAGVHEVLAGADLPDIFIGLRMKDMPILARDRVLFVGEPVVAVAAESADVADEALNLIDVQYEELPAVYDPEEALKPGSPVLHEDRSQYKNAPALPEEIPNLQSFTVWKHGDIEEGFKNADRTFEHTFSTQLTHHGYLEPHACTMKVDSDGKVEVWASNKGPYSLRDNLADILGIEAKQIKVHIMSVGGDFGGKASMVDAPICYFLAQRSGRPVKMVLGYDEELIAAAHRHPGVITLKTGVDRDGKITAMQADILFSGGAYAAFKANPPGTVLGGRRLASFYHVPAIHVVTRCAYTNQVGCTQSRTPGSPQIVFATESQMDIIAREIDLDPAEFRRRNIIDEGDPSPMGDKWDHIYARQTFEQAVKDSGWGRSKLGKNCGRGMAVYERGAPTGKASAAITIETDGSITLLTGCPDIGTGFYTVAQQIVCETLGAAPERVRIRFEDTDSLPYDPGTGGSKSTNTSGHAAYQVAREVRKRLVALAARRLGCSPEKIQQEYGRFVGPGRKAVSFDEVA